MDKSEKEITVTKAINPVDGPVDGVMIVCLYIACF